MKRIRLVLLAAPTFVPISAVAQPVTGPYVSLGAGVDFLQNEIFKPYGNAGPLKRTYTFDPGVGLSAAVGYGLGNGLRVEIEGDYANNRVRGVQLSLPERAGGNEQQFGGFLNTLYDFNLDFPVYPYLGAGAGYQGIDLDRINSSQPAAAINSGAAQYGGAFAYQGIAGFSYPLTLMPGLSLTAEYRLVGVLSPPPFDRSNGSGNNVVVNGAAQSSRATVNNIFNHEATVGLRYVFNAAPPAPPPTDAAVSPAPTPARTYLVFFDWDRSDLTDRARQIIAEAAQASTRVQTTRIEVDGYTDASGTPAYNQRLSKRRADVVAGELVRDGVPRAAISIQGFGESNPLVPTADGVREPQNRRVEVILK